MLTIGTVTYGLLTALLAAAAWQVLGKRLFSPEVRERRRRSRSYRRVVSRRHGPGVRLAVRVARS